MMMSGDSWGALPAVLNETPESLVIVIPKDEV
jgi:hypothetical protein